MIVHHLGDGHHRPLRARKRIDQVPSSWSRLFYEVDQGRATRVNLDQKRSEFRMAKHRVLVQRAAHDHNWQLSAIHWLRTTVLLWRPRHQVNHRLGWAPPNQRASQGHKQGVFLKVLAFLSSKALVRPGWSLNWHTLPIPLNLVWFGGSLNRHTLPTPLTRFSLDGALIGIPCRYHSMWFGLDVALTGIPCEDRSTRIS